MTKRSAFPTWEAFHAWSRDRARPFTTWGEFKLAVQAQGVKDEDRISYIDCGSSVLVLEDEGKPELEWILE